MPKRLVIYLLMSCLWTAFAFGSTCPTTNRIQNPPVFDWTFHPVTASNTEEYYSGTLQMGEVTLTIAGETLTTRAYGQEGRALTIPGPTLNMVPGNKYVLRFQNTLPYQAPDPDVNVLKDPDITNLHTHGLHLSGESPGDDVTRFFEGGFAGDFVYDIQPDHMGGTFWYHAHHHGSTFLQVSSGAFGLIVVDDGGDNIPANVAAMEERELLVAFLDPSVAGSGGDSLISGTLDPTWTVNGTVAGNVCLPPDTWQHWRVLLADRDARTKTVSVGSACEVALLARDGVWRTEVPKPLGNNSIDLTGASRADLAVRCSGDSDISVGSETVANVFVDGTADSTPSPYDDGSPWPSQRPTYLRDLRAETPDNTETIRMGARTINGRRFNHDVPNLELSADGLQEWSLNGARNHPFHLHVYHVQVTENCGEYEAGEYYDVVAQNCTLRFDLDVATSTVYEGRTIMHCHILEHEDQGAMGWANIVGGTGPPVFPVDGGVTTSYKDYYPFGGPPGNTPPAAPTAMNATAASSSEIDLSWSDNSSDETGFDIERSLDGSTFGVLASVPADSTTFRDSGLEAATPYYYRANAYNGAGSSGYSNTASATTSDPPGQGTALAVGSITLSTFNAGRGFKGGRAVVVVTDDLGTPVSQAVVGGYFTGTFDDTISASTATDGNGSTTIDTSGTAKGGISVGFCVTSITDPSSLTDFTGLVCNSN